MDTDELIKKIRARVAKCRELAKYVNDRRTTETLLQMAADGEADLARLEAEGMIPTSMIDGVGQAKRGEALN